MKIQFLTGFSFKCIYPLLFRNNFEDISKIHVYFFYFFVYKIHTKKHMEISQTDLQITKTHLVMKYVCTLPHRRYRFISHTACSSNNNKIYQSLLNTEAVYSHCKCRVPKNIFTVIMSITEIQYLT